MATTIFFFWASLAVLFYCYFGYGILVFIINSFREFFIEKKKMIFSEPFLPVTIIITAYNEEKSAGAKNKKHSCH